MQVDHPAATAVQELADQLAATQEQLANAIEMGEVAEGLRAEALALAREAIDTATAEESRANQLEVDLASARADATLAQSALAVAKVSAADELAAAQRYAGAKENAMYGQLAAAQDEIRRLEAEKFNGSQ